MRSGWPKSRKTSPSPPWPFPFWRGRGPSPPASFLPHGREDPFAYLALLAGSAVVFGATFLLLSRADELLGWVGALGTAILTRIMGLILAFIAVEYVLEGVVEVIKS